jgi:uncharacterized membrane protein YkoI
MKILIFLLTLTTLTRISHAEDTPAIARISLHEATQTILGESSKRVLRATTEIIDGREVHVIKVLTPDGHIIHYKIDAETGKLIN